MTRRGAIIRLLGSWAVAWLVAALLGSAPAHAHGGHHHDAPRAGQPAAPVAPAAAIVVAIPDAAAVVVTACRGDHAPVSHAICCVGASCCAAGCTAAALLADVPSPLPARPSLLPGDHGLDPAGRHTRPPEHPPRPTI